MLIGKNIILNCSLKKVLNLRVSKLYFCGHPYASFVKFICCAFNLHAMFQTRNRCIFRPFLISRIHLFTCPSGWACLMYTLSHLCKEYTFASFFMWLNKLSDLHAKRYFMCMFWYNNHASIPYSYVWSPLYSSQVLVQDFNCALQESFLLQVTSNWWYFTSHTH